MGARVRLKVLELLKERPCLATMEICRLLNGFAFDNYQVCHEGMEFGAIRTWDGLCQWEKNGCKYPYKKFLYTGGHSGDLWTLVRKGFLKTKKLRFWDKGKALPTDVFRFWYRDEKDFQERVLRQTLIPYVEVEKR